jgi:hypothetical protein
MRWTSGVALFGSAIALGGCVYGYGTMVQANYSTSSRPHPTYYCYDCHGYRFFDPYYDYCVGNGYRYRWADQPRVMALYRERYVRIRETHPDYGRYRYAPDYRSSSRYREGKRYENGRPDGRPEPKRRRRDEEPEQTREKRRDPPGTKDGSREPREPRGQGRRNAALVGG